MPRKYFRRYLPSAAEVRENRWVGLFGTLLHHPNLWHLNRDSVAGAVAIGLFAGLLPAPLQMLSAALFAVLFHRNLPVAVLVTLYTNPFTIVPLYLLAFAYGSFLLGSANARAPIEPFEMDWGNVIDSMARLWDWTFSLGPRLIVGLAALGLTLAVLGYFAVQLGWRAYVIRAWRARARRRAAR